MTLLITGTTGINNVSDPTSIGYDPKTGMSDLAEGVNIQISPNGGIDRADGYSFLQAGSFHSLFCDQGDCFVGRTTDLLSVNMDWSLTGVRSGLSGSKISFCQVADETFYTNGTQNGRIISKTSWPWTYNDPAVSLSSRIMAPVPVAEHLDFFAGRIFFTLNDLLCWTELGLWGLYCPKTNCHRFGSRIRMIKHVDNGMFVSDGSGTYFLAGKDPLSFQYNPVANFPAYEWSAATGYVEGLDIGVSQPGLCALWCSPEGAILGTSTGQIINLNKEKIIYPEDGYSGAGGLLRGYQFINTIF